MYLFQIHFHLTELVLNVALRHAPKTMVVYFYWSLTEFLMDALNDKCQSLRDFGAEECLIAVNDIVPQIIPMYEVVKYIAQVHLLTEGIPMGIPSVSRWTCAMHFSQDD